MFPGSRPDALSVRLSAQTRALLEDTKALGGFANDAQAIRAALAVHHHLARRKAEGYKLYIGTAEGKLTRELRLPR